MMFKQLKGKKAAAPQHNSFAKTEKRERERERQWPKSNEILFYWGRSFISKFSLFVGVGWAWNITPSKHDG